MSNLLDSLTDRKSSMAVRGICAVLVALGHSVKAEYYIPIPGSFFVGVFFFYSGYNIMYNFVQNEKYLDSFVRKRFCKLWLPFCLAEIIYMELIEILRGGEKALE